MFVHFKGLGHIGTCGQEQKHGKDDPGSSGHKTKANAVNVRHPYYKGIMVDCWTDLRGMSEALAILVGLARLRFGPGSLEFRISVRPTRSRASHGTPCRSSYHLKTRLRPQVHPIVLTANKVKVWDSSYFNADGVPLVMFQMNLMNKIGMIFRRFIPKANLSNRPYR